MSWIVKTTDAEGQEWHNGPFASRAAAYTWASKQADDFVTTNKLDKSRLDADGESNVWVEGSPDDACGFSFSAEALQLIPPF